MTTEKSTTNGISGWMKIREPDDIERALARTINKILTSGDCITHSGRLASLCNSWIACRRLKIDSKEIQELKDRLTRLEANQEAKR